jgi:Bacterial Ig domain
VQDEINSTVSTSRRFTTAPAVPPAVELTAPVANARLAAPASVRLTASVTSARPIARVEFYTGNTKLGETRAAPHEITWANPATGPHALSAVAVDDTGAFALSRVVPVSVFNAAGAPPQVALTSPPAGTIALPGVTLALTANATATPTRNATILLVEFFDGTAKIGESRAAPFTVAWTPVAGTHTLTARATDTDGQTATSAPLALTVGDGDPGRVLNFSVLSGVGPGNAALILGFVTGGAGTTGNKPLLVRALGPALTRFGLPTAADPTATLFTGATAAASNDNWAGNAAVISTGAAVGAFPLTDPASRDAAFTATRPNGAHTIVVGGTGGPILAELYDATPGASFTSTTPRLLNTSARTLVAAGNDTLLAGLVVGGTAARTFVLRAIGPGLAPYGITNGLADPRLEIFRAGSATPLATNDNWSGDPALVIASINAGAFPLDPASRDAALLLTFAPGVYTLRLTGPAGTTGVALIDIYEVP